MDIDFHNFSFNQFETQNIRVGSMIGNPENFLIKNPSESSVFIPESAITTSDTPGGGSYFSSPVTSLAELQQQFSQPITDETPFYKVDIIDHRTKADQPELVMPGWSIQNAEDMDWVALALSAENWPTGIAGLMTVEHFKDHTFKLYAIDAPPVFMNRVASKAYNKYLALKEEYSDYASSHIDQESNEPLPEKFEDISLVPFGPYSEKDIQAESDYWQSIKFSFPSLSTEDDSISILPEVRRIIDQYVKWNISFDPVQHIEEMVRLPQEKDRFKAYVDNLIIRGEIDKSYLKYINPDVNYSSPPTLELTAALQEVRHQMIDALEAGFINPKAQAWINGFFQKTKKDEISPET
jgi:hypothetical protein